MLFNCVCTVIFWFDHNRKTIENCDVLMKTIVMLKFTQSLGATYYLPPGWCRGRDGDLNYAKFKCITYRACRSVKSQPSPHLKDGDLQGDLLVYVYISVHAHCERSNFLHIGQLLVPNQVKCPTFPSLLPGRGVVGHNIDRCIIRSRSSMLKRSILQCTVY